MQDQSGTGAKGPTILVMGEKIPLAGRISALADVFDALTSTRPYKQPRSIEDAFALVRKEAGEHFDPRLAPLFISLEPELRRIQETYKDAEAE